MLRAASPSVSCSTPTRSASRLANTRECASATTHASAREATKERAASMPTVFPSVRTEEFVFVLESADVPADTEDDTVTKSRVTEVAGTAENAPPSTEWPSASALRAGPAPNAKRPSVHRAAGTVAAVWLQESAAVQRDGWAEPATPLFALSPV